MVIQIACVLRHALSDEMGLFKGSGAEDSVEEDDTCGKSGKNECIGEVAGARCRDTSCLE